MFSNIACIPLLSNLSRRAMTSRSAPNHHLLEQLAPYFHESSTPCPYGLPYHAIYRVAGFYKIPDDIMGSFLAAGYRRNGNNVWLPFKKFAKHLRALVERFWGPV